MKAIAKMSCVLCFVVALAVVPHAQLSDPIFKSLKPRAIGPAIMSGRITDFAVVETNPAVFYVGTAGGGVLKTVNLGNTWEFVFDRQGSSSIGDVTVDPKDPDVVWVGTGEANNRQSSSWGDGVYKSTDGGKTWTHLGLKETQHIGRIVIDPTNTDVVYVAAVGHLWGPNRERGVFKTTDGGTTWSHVLSINEDTGVTDLVIDPANPRVLIAAAYQRRRAAWGFNGGGPHSGMYKTVDAGRTWKKLTAGLPSGETGRIGLDIYRKNPAIVYATIENREGGIYRSEDRGETWVKVNSLNSRPMYFSQIRIDPNDDRQLWVGGDRLNHSMDGGRTFNTDAARGVHLDHHALWIDPSNPNHVLIGNDGGVWVTWDRAKSWDHISNVAIGQFYNISVDMRKPYFIYGGLQDNFAWAGPSATRNRIGIVNDDWVHLNPADGMYAQVDPTDPTTVYTNMQNGRLIRFDLKTGERKTIMPRQASGEQEELRWNWTSPVLISPHDARVVYTGANRLFRSPDRGHSWMPISGDLSTAPRRDTFPIMGVVAKDISVAKHDGVESFGNITTVSESPKRAGVIYVGTDDGQVQVTRDGGRTWRNVTGRMSGVPKMTYVSRVTASAHEEGLVYASFDGHRSDDFAPYVCLSADYGETWRSLSATLPAGGPVYVVKEDPRNPTLVYLGTEFGLFVSWNRGANWTRWSTVPTVAVYDLVVHPRDNDLVLGTHGLSLLVVDDVTPIQQFVEDVRSANSFLFDLRPATEFLVSDVRGPQRLGGRDQRAPNPEFGAYINYYLKAALKEEVKITVLDAGGGVVRELRGPRDAGISRVVWDLRTDPPGTVSAALGGLGGTTAAGGGAGTNEGVLVLPGDYRVRITAGGEVHAKMVRVDADPLAAISEADRRKLYASLIVLNNMQSTANIATGVVDRVVAQLVQIGELLKSQPGAAGVKGTLESASRQVQDVVRRLIGGDGGADGGGGTGVGGRNALRNRIGQLRGEVGNSQTLPTASQTERLEAYFKDLNDLLSEINTITSTTMPALYKQINYSDVGPAFEAIKPVARGTVARLATFR
jgi:photosystem II stability/assembly factor-like uncharacterized protein